MQNPQADLRLSAVAALERQSGDKALELIKKALQDPALRKRAVIALFTMSGSQAKALQEDVLQSSDNAAVANARLTQKNFAMEQKRNALATFGSLDPARQVDLARRCERVLQN